MYLFLPKRDPVVSNLKPDEVAEVGLGGEHSGIDSETTRGCFGLGIYIFTAQNCLVAGNPDEGYGIRDG